MEIGCNFLSRNNFLSSLLAPRLNSEIIFRQSPKSFFIPFLWLHFSQLKLEINFYKTERK